MPTARFEGNPRALTMRRIKGGSVLSKRLKDLQRCCSKRIERGYACG
jgi:hypothetical protein